jgi:glycosyltransferase involved in cell wall biosynthesis
MATQRMPPPAYSPDIARPLLSVVIPTRNRRELLHRSLCSLENQAGVEGAFEVIVADDGSSDGTAELLESLAGKLSYPLYWLRLPGSGAATARNRALALATAPRALLLGDDTVPDRDALSQHLSGAEGATEVAIQGRIEWDAEQQVTPVMRFLAPEGPQFYFKGLRPGRPIPYTIVYGSNLSAPTRWFREDPFDERFPSAAFEDTELAYRWLRKGRRTIYSEKAVCRHRHHYASIEQFLDRQRIAGRAARRAIILHPGMALRTVLAPVLIGLWRGAQCLWDRLRGNLKPERRWDLQCRIAFLRGFVAGHSDGN